MSVGLSLAKQAYSAFNREKPHSSITDLIEILTSPTYEEEAYDGIPELVDVISLQPTGPAEASRAIRKKLKHGDAHRQYRALVLLKATVENGGQKFQTTFADGQLTDAIKHLAADSSTDPKVKRKLISVLLSWRRQFEGDARMTLVANLYKSVPQTRAAAQARPSVSAEPQESEYEKRKREERERKEEEKRKAKQAKLDEKQRREEEERNRKNKGKKRAPFDFEKEKPNVLNSIAETSQASNNLVNALTLVNTEHEQVQDNARVQECLEKAKAARKRVVRYIQLVENEEFVGTLLETNERVITALQMYDALIRPDLTAQDVEKVQEQMAAVNINHAGGELDRLQEKQRAAVERSMKRNRARENDQTLYDSPPQSASAHPDLQDLTFGELGDKHRDLPPPMRPTAQGSDSEDFEQRGSLSDFSDYPSDEEPHNQHAGASATSASTSYGSKPAGRHYINVSDDHLAYIQDAEAHLIDVDEDPFADPFADHKAVR